MYICVMKKIIFQKIMWKENLVSNKNTRKRFEIECDKLEKYRLIYRSNKMTTRRK